MNKSLLFLSILGTLLFMFACQEEDLDTSKTEAIITGYDFSLCPCCGGWMITTTDNPIPREEEFYLWSNPTDFPDLEIDSFPLYIKMDFAIDSNRCFNANPWINVSDLEVIK